MNSEDDQIQIKDTKKWMCTFIKCKVCPEQRKCIYCLIRQGKNIEL